MSSCDQADRAAGEVRHLPVRRFRRPPSSCCSGPHADDGHRLILLHPADHLRTHVPLCLSLGFSWCRLLIGNRRVLGDAGSLASDSRWAPRLVSTPTDDQYASDSVVLTFLSTSNIPCFTLRIAAMVPGGRPDAAGALTSRIDRLTGSRSARRTGAWYRIGLTSHEQGGLMRNGFIGAGNMVGAIVRGQWPRERRPDTSCSPARLRRAPGRPVGADPRPTPQTQAHAATFSSWVSSPSTSFPASCPACPEAIGRSKPLVVLIAAGLTLEAWSRCCRRHPSGAHDAEHGCSRVSP